MSTNEKDAIRQRAENDLSSFIKLVHPQRLLGLVHNDVISWWTRQDHKSHQLLLLPRDHMKSALVAYRAAWEITRDPTVRILYISSTANLATKQIKFIKDILTSSIYRRYWPEMVNKEEGKREKWTETEFSVDHPLRAEEAVRDPTVFTAGLTTSITGLHCDVAILDDIVVNENAYTEDGRDKVKTQYSLLSSIEGAEALEWVVGTRYHPKDLYNDMLGMTVDQYNEDGEIINADPLYEVMERQVEDLGDGTGEFLWPKQRRYDGKFFGFDVAILAKKRAQYLDRIQFRAQYYNDPNDPASAAIDRDYFQYYEPKFLSRQSGRWYVKERPINVFAAIDFAYSLEKKADFTAIVIIGVDANHNYYILDIERFKSTKISEYFSKILQLHRKWDFRKLVAEITAGQKVIVNDLKDNYIRQHGLALSIQEHKPTRHQGRKEERINLVLQHRYENLQMWHYRGGNCQVLEEELVLQNPPHDDVKDALAACIEYAQPPSRTAQTSKNYLTQHHEAIMSNRFGGIV
jgi:hypothetical protein